MNRQEEINNNKFKVLLSIREDRIKKEEPRTMKKLVQRIIQWRLIGYVVIGVSLYQLEIEPTYLIFQMFILILFTELQARGVSKKRIDTLKEELNIQQEYTMEDKKDIRVQALNHKASKDALKVKEDIEKNYKPRL